MNRRIATRADKRVPVAVGMLAAVLALLGAHRIAFPGAGEAAQPVQMAAAMTSAPAP